MWLLDPRQQTRDLLPADGRPLREPRLRLESCADVEISSTIFRDALVSRASCKVDNLFIIRRELVVLELFFRQGDNRDVLDEVDFERQIFG